MRLRDLTSDQGSAAERSLPELTESQRRSLKWSRRLAQTMDRQWGIGPWRIGVESVADLVPVFGDLVSGGASAYQLWVASQLKLSRADRVRMLTNMGVDLGLGLVPFAGDFFDAVFKVHLRNQRIIDRHIEQ